MNEQFTWYRLGLLIRNDFVSGYRLYLNIFTVLVIIMMLNTIPSAGLGHTRDGFYYGWFAGLLMIWGSVHTSLMFRELYDKKRNEAWLLLPASLLEKILARYLNASVLFILQMLVFVTVTALVIEGINMSLFGRTNGIFNPFNPGVWDAIGVYMVIQPVFFLGAVWFRKACWFKTVISVSLISFVLAILALITFLIMFAGHFGELNILFNHGFEDMHLDGNIKLFSGIVTGFKIFCYGILPPFCVYVSWLRVRETQVSYGV